MAQFSPGDLARPHHDLEGTNQCARCHDIGKEITGTKCLTCHTAIDRSIQSGRGFHFTATRDKKCVSCHKDHLGIDARITIVKAADVDHNQTGFALTGKHAKVKCEQCHQAKFVKDPDVMKSLARAPRTTWLGLDEACSSCHEDRHRGKLGTNCVQCHTTSAWNNIPAFDHSKTKFALAGSHRTVACIKCHPSISPGGTQAPVDLTTKAFTDCTPCHANPHSNRFAAQTCAGCHTVESWKNPGTKPFDHNLTAFRLLGKHAQVKCQQCHKESGAKLQGGTLPGAALKLAHDKCTDCHADAHAGQFAKKYRNDCARCHTVDGFVPSTFTMSDHQIAFALSGAHAATLCNSCHTMGADNKRVYRYASTACSACHQDPHRGEFRTMMGSQGCVTCHTTVAWNAVKFDHSATTFPLEGKHRSAACDKCHTPAASKKVPVSYKGVSHDCVSCHKDVHAKQFEQQGKVDCASCHKPEGWKTLTFDHNASGRFSLTGAHKNVPCASCHKNETIGASVVVRYKPLSPACESCHKGMKQ